jgi:hypothetical protein
MNAALDFLVELHNNGIYLRAISDEELEYEGPKELVTDEVVADLRKHKRELLALLEWDKEAAHALIREALAYLAKRDVEGSAFSTLDSWEDRLNEACAREDMGSLRVAVRGFVRDGLASLRKDDDA